MPLPLHLPVVPSIELYLEEQAIIGWTYLLLSNYLPNTMQITRKSWQFCTTATGITTSKYRNHTLKFPSLVTQLPKNRKWSFWQKKIRWKNVINLKILYFLASIILTSWRHFDITILTWRQVFITCTKFQDLTPMGSVL